MIKYICDLCETESKNAYDILNLTWSSENATGLKQVGSKVKLMLCPDCMKIVLEKFSNFLSSLSLENLIEEEKWINIQTKDYYTYLGELPDYSNNNQNNIYVILQYNGKKFVKNKKEFLEEFRRVE